MNNKHLNIVIYIGIYIIIILNERFTCFMLFTRNISFLQFNNRDNLITPFSKSISIIIMNICIDIY